MSAQPEAYLFQRYIYLSRSIVARNNTSLPRKVQVSTA